MTSLKKTLEKKKGKPVEEKIYMFFNICAEVSYIDVMPKELEIPVYKTSKVSMMYRGSKEGIMGAELNHLTQSIYQLFHKEYEKTLAKINKTIPEVVKVVIIGVSPLAYTTQTIFGAGLNLPPPAEPEPRKKEEPSKESASPPSK